MKKNIRIVLSGGGTRCAYQYKILDELIKSNVYDNINIDCIYGTSFGSVVALYFCLGKLDLLEKLFMSMNQESLVKSFDLWGYDKYIRNIPLLGDHIGNIIDILWIIESIKSKGLYKPTFGIDAFKSLDLTNSNNLSKFYCSVFNVNTNKIEFINGNHPFILDYIIASCALWLVFPPVFINRLSSECICDELCNCKKDKLLCYCTNYEHSHNEFIDVGFIDQVPFEYDDNFDGEYYIITTKDYNKLKTSDFKLNNTGNHLFEYLDKLITYQSNYIQSDIINNHTNWNKSNIHLINFNLDSDDACNVNDIKQYMDAGKIKSKEFIDQIIK